MKFFGKLVLSTLAIVLTAELLPGIHIEEPFVAFLVALLLAFLNVTIKPLFIIFTIPITVVTFGIFLLFINGFIILMADYFISGFTVDGFGWAVLFSILMSIINSIFEGLVYSNKKNS